MQIEKSRLLEALGSGGGMGYDNGEALLVITGHLCEWRDCFGISGIGCTALNTLAATSESELQQV